MRVSDNDNINEDRDKMRGMRLFCRSMPTYMYMWNAYADMHALVKLPPDSEPDKAYILLDRYLE